MRNDVIEDWIKDVAPSFRHPPAKSLRDLQLLHCAGQWPPVGFFSQVVCKKFITHHDGTKSKTKTEN